MSLRKEVESASIEVHSDSYTMSIGELINLYRDGELDIHPEFQRFFRWRDLQKTRLIESFLLKIPIPSIFVSQLEDGKWDVIDGVQRLSTIFEFIGILRDENGDTLPPFTLKGTDYLPSLEGKRWSDPNDQDNSFSQFEQLVIKRSKIYVIIILRESDVKSKYELFQRLNTGGSSLTDQEVRNCLLIMQNKSMFLWLKELSANEDFKDCVSLNERLNEEQYDVELVLRFVVLRRIETSELKMDDIGEFLTKKMTNIAFNPEFNFEEEAEAFKTTFEILNKTTQADSFRKFDHNKNKFTGGFLISAFEIVALGIGYHYVQYKGIDIDAFSLEEILKLLWKDDRFIQRSGGGVNASTRIRRTVPLGREYFQSWAAKLEH